MSLLDIGYDSLSIREVIRSRLSIEREMKVTLDSCMDQLSARTASFTLYFWTTIVSISYDE